MSCIVIQENSENGGIRPYLVCHVCKHVIEDIAEGHFVWKPDYDHPKIIQFLYPVHKICDRVIWAQIPHTRWATIEEILSMLRLNIDEQRLYEMQHKATGNVIPLKITIE
jgi:hypothetical protein